LGIVDYLINHEMKQETNIYQHQDLKKRVLNNIWGERIRAFLRKTRLGFTTALKHENPITTPEDDHDNLMTDEFDVGMLNKNSEITILANS
jgi:hypothetical protein